MKKIDKEYFIKVVNESLTMRQACITLNMQFSTFKRWAEKFNCYKPNQGAKGLKKSNPNYFTENDLKRAMHLLSKGHVYSTLWL